MEPVPCSLFWKVNLKNWAAKTVMFEKVSKPANLSESLSTWLPLGGNAKSGFTSNCFQGSDTKYGLLITGGQITVSQYTNQTEIFKLENDGTISTCPGSTGSELVQVPKAMFTGALLGEVLYSARRNIRFIIVVLAG